jgi:1-deoxy-D-xylulose-5-phosphate synthase
VRGGWTRQIPDAKLDERRQRDMVLERIEGPADLKSLPERELDVLAEEIRDLIIRTVSRTGGHLGSNLGAVELAIALHRVFDSPRDALLWDTGHQAYAHKLLTGRRDRFHTLRQAGGVAGYPCRAESPHDWVENSHASTALSYAFGLARAARPAGEGAPPAAGGRVVAVIGDGALTGGLAYEGLNNLGHSRLPVVVVLNDNGRSYAPTVSRLAGSISWLRLDRRYLAARRSIGRRLERAPSLGRAYSAGLRGVRAATSEAPRLQPFVEALGLRYLGPFDGHDITALERALRAAADCGDPVLVHVLTSKGRGYAPAEEDEEKRLHDTGPFTPEVGPVSEAGGARSYTDVFAQAVRDIALADERVVAVTAAMPGSTGLLPLQEANPEQVIDVGIAEAHAAAMAAGLAFKGRLPIVAVYSTFFSRAFDQANLDVGLHRAHVVFAFDRAGITGPDGPSHHGMWDLALTLRIPSMTVLVPSSAPLLAAMLRAAVHDLDGPVAIRFPKGVAVEALVGGHADPLRAARLRDGDDVCIVAYGDRVPAALEAAGALAAGGIAATVWDARVAKPLDAAMLTDVARFPLVVTVENGIVHGGAGGYLAERLADLFGLAAPRVCRLGIPDAYIPAGSAGALLAELGLDAAGIAAGVTDALDRAAVREEGMA